MQPYHHFTLEERENLQALLREGKSIRQIARELGRAASSISRELARNKSVNDKYQPWYATCNYLHRRKKSRRNLRIQPGQRLYQWVLEKLQQYWSPETITALWKRENPSEKLSFSTIYRSLRRGLFTGVSARTHLRRRGKLRFYKKKTNYNSVKPIHLIDARPAAANNRLRIGDWECDTVFGGVGKGYLVSCIDRKSRYIAAQVALTKSTACVNKAMIDALRHLPVETITLDNGSEFAEFATIEKELNSTVYFAQPHAPWQRGTNENLNDCLRFFFPRGSDFRALTHDRLAEVLSLLNNRPRKCLGWLSPADVFFSACCN